MRNLTPIILKCFLVYSLSQEAPHILLLTHTLPTLREPALPQGFLNCSGKESRGISQEDGEEREGWDIKEGGSTSALLTM